MLYVLMTKTHDWQGKQAEGHWQDEGEELEHGFGVLYGDDVCVGFVPYTIQPVSVLIAAHV
jgi:hypothetical protein